MRIKSSIAAPALLCIIFILLICFEQYIDESNLIGSNVYLNSVIVQLCIFFLPCIFFINFKGKQYVTKLRIRTFKPSHITLTLLAVLLIIILGALVSAIGSFFFGAGDVQYSTYGSELIPDGRNVWISILAFIFIPVLLEEFVFRSVIFAEYEQYGAFFAVLFSSLTFAMIHFSFRYFIYYFITGIILASIAKATGSVFPCVIAHFANNLFTVFGQKYILSAIRLPSGSVFIIFALILIALLVLFFFLTALDRIYVTLAYETALPENFGSKPKLSVTLSEIFLSPSFLVLVTIFAVYSVNKF